MLLFVLKVCWGNVLLVVVWLGPFHQLLAQGGQGNIQIENITCQTM